jgi:signal peptidase I
VADEKVNDMISQRWKKPWTANNFGPVTVPEDHYFVLGDNRDNAADSRYIGFIPKKNWKGTVLNKH